MTRYSIVTFASSTGLAKFRASEHRLCEEHPTQPTFAGLELPAARRAVRYPAPLVLSPCLSLQRHASQ
jgi:hypothetical protein